MQYYHFLLQYGCFRVCHQGAINNMGTILFHGQGRLWTLCRGLLRCHEVISRAVGLFVKFQQEGQSLGSQWAQ